MSYFQKIRNLRGALSSVLEQVDQMKGIFPDDDGAIADAIQAGEEALDETEGLEGPVKAGAGGTVFWEADVSLDGGTIGIAPFYAHDHLAAEIVALAKLKELLPDCDRGWETWGDVEKSSDGASIWGVSPERALAGNDLLKTNITPQMAAEALQAGKAIGAYTQDAKIITAPAFGELVEGIATEAMTKAAEAEPLPIALAMIDTLISKGGEVEMLARAARIALAKLVSAGTELDSMMGEAIEAHIYNFTDGEEIPADCNFTAAVNGWAKAMSGEASSYLKPASPLPWRLHINEQAEETSMALLDANGALALPWIATTDTAHVKNAMTILESVNAQASMAMMPEIAVVIEGGLVTSVVARNAVPMHVYIVDYDTEGGDTEDLMPIHQGAGNDAMAYIGKWDAENFGESKDNQFWADLRVRR